MTKYTEEQWEEIGRKWRQAAEMDNSPLLNAPKFVRWLKHSGYIKDYVRLPDEDLPSADGRFDPDSETVFYRESVWQAAESGTPRANWTLVHEGCHAIFKHQEVRHRATGASNLSRLSSRTRRDEAETDRLAAAIIAPFDKADFKPGMSVDDLMKTFGLSRRAAEIRLEQFERLYRRKHGLQRDLPPGVVDFLVKRKRQGFPVTSVDDAMLPRSQDARYEGDPCPSCGEFKLVRAALSRRCDSCGATAGDD